MRRLWRGYQPVFLDYHVDMKPRWADDVGNPHLARIISARRDAFVENLSKLMEFKPVVDEIINGTSQVKDINWRNGYIPALDGLTLMRAAVGAKSTYMEIGSGHSTSFVKAALLHTKSSVQIVSIDPEPRAEIDALCDKSVRSRLEDVDLAIFDELEPGDALFIDNSHRSFMNSDVTVAMLDVLPRLKPGVLIGIHDILLPFDYPEHWAKWAYNEQYLLGCQLLSNPDYFEMQFANYWISRNRLHVEPLRAIWSMLGDDVRDRSSSAFWGIKN
jgi:hypothetical protein